ncbi:PREDICTED: leukocyte surface antigen CD53-like [Amphimedon queenslandica]|uniref:Tetraspanin n=1 Tax=Amphimedon queenslandica TaxID=400682 RepID=A0A1X7VXK1_AMPQE|nr:PREDICTED: leukocyte surface antigen CD53-like [Amphimedon queenslandica]|eukprot:XP_003382521.1 PREDICTED: leukocyte surface antigen CD53-like [Amphimedon queenslandica]
MHAQRDRSRLRSEWFKIFLRVCLIIANVIVVILGITICTVGGLIIHDNKHYVEIIGHYYNGVPAMFIVLGVLVCLIGFLGTIGGIFVQLLCGRIVLRIYACLLALLVTIEIICGIAAAIESDRVELNSKIKKSFLEYNNKTEVKDTWDYIQQTLECCGLNGYKSYEDYLTIDPPSSCCMDVDNCSSDKDFFQDDCETMINAWVSGILSVSSIVIITFAILQIFAVVVALFISFVDNRGRRNNYDVVRDDETSYLFSQ